MFHRVSPSEVRLGEGCSPVGTPARSWTEVWPDSAAQGARWGRACRPIQVSEFQSAQAGSRKKALPVSIPRRPIRRQGRRTTDALHDADDSEGLRDGEA